MSHFILVAILVYSLVPGEAQSSDPPAAQDNSTLLIGVSAYDPYLNRDIIFATPMGTKLVTAESRLYFVDFGDRRYTSIQLNPPDMGLTTMEFDPGTSGLLATCATPGHPAYFGSVNLTSGECLPKATLPSHVKIKIGVSAYDDQRQMYFMSARERGSFDDGDVILRIQGKKQYKVDILKATFGPNSIFELVQLSINPKYYGVEVSQAVALNVIYADKQSGWQQMMVDFGEAESPSQSPTGIAVQNRASRRKNVTAEHLGDLSSTNVDWETMYTELTMNNEDFQKTPVPIQSGLSMYVQTETELSNFISSDPLGPFEAPEFVPGFPQLLSNAENLDGYNFKIKMIRICRVVIGAINMDQMIRQNKMPTKDAMISIASAGTTAFDFYRGGVTADVRDPAQAIAMSISNLPCNTNLRLFYLTRFGEKAESDVTEWRPSGMNRLMCKQGQFCPNTDDGKVENSPCTLCLPGTYQPYNNTLAGRCFICPYGFVTSLGGQKECTACAPGKYTGSSRQGIPLHLSKSYIRVTAVVMGNLIGALSAPSNGWITAGECGDTRYLDNNSSMLQDWQCVNCPAGGDCSGDILWDGVRAQFGYYRLGEEDRDLESKRYYQPCINPKACLGGENKMLEGSFFDSDENDMALQNSREVCNYDLGFETHFGDVIFNPSCSSSAKTNTMFYEKQAFILCLPLVCIGLMGVGIVYVGISNRVEKQKSDRKKRQIQQRLKKRGLGSGLDSSGAKKKEREEKKRKNEALSNSLRAKKSAKVSPLKIVKKQQKKNKKFVLPLTTFDKFTSMMVTFLYLVYPSLCKATFTLVSCRKVGINWYLQMDMDLLCNSPDHISWVVVLFLPGLLLYVIGLPLAAFFYLRRHRRVINDPKMKFKFGVLFAGYRYGHSSWECVIALRKATIIFVSIVLAGAGAGPQALLAVLAILLFALWHMQAKPFIRVLDKEDILDSAESIALLVTLITLWTGLFFFQEIPRIGTLPAFLSTALLIFNLAFLTMLLRWWLIFLLMDIHTKRRTLSAGLHRSGCEGRMMQLMERFLPSLISRKDAKWKHARVKILAVARMIIHFKRIRERVAAGEQAAFRAHHVGKRNLLKLNLLPHRKTIEEQRTRMAAIERLKGTILPMAKEQKFQTPRNATRVVPKGVLSGRRTPTRIYPMGIPSPSLGRLTPTDSRPGSTQSRSGSRLSRPGSKSRRRSPESEGKQKSPKLTQLVPAKTAFKGKNRQQQAAMMKIIAAKKLKQRQKALEKAEAERERLKKDPEWQKKDIKRKLNLAVDTQFVAKQGLKAMIEGESRRLQQEKSKLRAQMEKLMQLGKSRKLTPPQVAKLKETLSQLKKKYESLIQKEKVLALKSKHV
eukprot:Stramenopile-MAST_4_protein_1557